MTEESKEVEKVEKALPMRQAGGQGTAAGFDEVDNTTDIIMPRLAVLQGLSEMVTDRKGAMGDLANSLTKEIYGESLEFIPLFLFKTRVQFETGRGLVMMSRDNQFVTLAKDEFAQYKGLPIEEVPGHDWEGDEPPKFHVVYNFPVMLPGRLAEFPLSLSMMRTAAKTAKNFISMARTTGEDFFSRVYKLSTKIEKNDKGTYAVPVVEISRRATDEEYAAALNQFKTLYTRRDDIAVDLDEEPLADSEAV